MYKHIAEELAAEIIKPRPSAFEVEFHEKPNPASPEECWQFRLYETAGDKNTRQPGLIHAPYVCKFVKVFPWGAKMHITRTLGGPVCYNFY